MTDKTRCDGETFFGFTVKSCDKAATRRLANSEHEVYWFCERHHYFAVHGRYPEQATEDEPTAEDSGPNAIKGITWRDS